MFLVFSSYKICNLICSNIILVRDMSNFVVRFIHYSSVKTDMRSVLDVDDSAEETSCTFLVN